MRATKEVECSLKELDPSFDNERELQKLDKDFPYIRLTVVT